MPRWYTESLRTRSQLAIWKYAWGCVEGDKSEDMQEGGMGMKVCVGGGGGLCCSFREAKRGEERQDAQSEDAPFSYFITPLISRQPGRSALLWLSAGGLD